MGGIDHHGIHAGLDQSHHPIKRVGRGADRSAHTQASALVFAGARPIGGLLDIFDGDQTLELMAVADHQHLLDAVLVEELQHVLARGVLAHGDEALLRRHHRRDGLVEVLLEAQVAARDDTDDLLALHHRHAGDAARAGELEHLADGGVGRDGDGVEHHAALVLLDAGDLAGLRLDGHAFVDDADTALLGDGDGETGFGDRVHCSRDDRQVEADGAGQLRGEVDLAGQHLGISRDEQHVIEGECFLQDAHRGGCPSKANGRRILRFGEVAVYASVPTRSG